MKVNVEKFDKIVEREEAEIAKFPEHSLDWHFQSVKVQLLKEVAETFEEVQEVQAPKAKAKKDKVAVEETVVENTKVEQTND